MGIFLDACQAKKTSYTPIWLNRQAGRYMPEYHALKGSTKSLEFFKTPELAAKATLDAQRILGVDAAIMFADLLPVLEPMGMKLDYLEKIGPVFETPIRTNEQVDALSVVPAEEGVGYIRDTILGILSDLPSEVDLIGFAGAPFTLASYAIEGRGSKNYVHVKKFMYGNPTGWKRLMDKLVETISDYVRLQYKSGVQAVQIFDSWIGCLSLTDYEQYVEPWTTNLMRRIHSQCGGDFPVIYFGTGNSHLVDVMYKTGPDFLALDWRTPLVPTWDRLGMPAVQGNLDPVILFAEPEVIKKKAKHILDQVNGRSGHIFNLGHGILPNTSPDNVKMLVDFVHDHDQSL